MIGLDKSKEVMGEGLHNGTGLDTRLELEEDVGTTKQCRLMLDLEDTTKTLGGVKQGLGKAGTSTSNRVEGILVQVWCMIAARQKRQAKDLCGTKVINVGYGKGIS